VLQLPREGNLACPPRGFHDQLSPQERHDQKLAIMQRKREGRESGTATSTADGKGQQFHVHKKVQEVGGFLESCRGKENTKQTFCCMQGNLRLRKGSHPGFIRQEPKMEGGANRAPDKAMKKRGGDRWAFVKRKKYDFLVVAKGKYLKKKTRSKNGGLLGQPMMHNSSQMRGVQKKRSLESPSPRKDCQGRLRGACAAASKARGKQVPDCFRDGERGRKIGEHTVQNSRRQGKREEKNGLARS